MWNTLRYEMVEVAWLVSMISGLSVFGVALAVSVALALA